MTEKSISGNSISDAQFVRSFQGIDEYQLENGLKILLFLDPSQANVTVNITYLVGSRHEGRGEAGMAHLLEHMLFRGTSLTRDIKAALQDRGAQFNATTWFDRTNYFETLTPSRENLEFALSLEADRMVNSLILAEDLAAEMTVVRNEFEMGENNPVHVLHDQLMSAAYLWHNYGKTTIGNRSDIERVPAKTLRRFYENYYQPDNAVLIVAGQFDKDDALSLIRKYFGSLKRPERILDQTYTEEPAQDGPREVKLLRVGDKACVAIGYHIPDARHPDHAPLGIFFDALADEPAGLIYQKLVQTEKISEVFAITYALHDPGMALFFVRPVVDETSYEIRDQLISLVEDKAVDFIADEQIARIKNRLLKRIRLSMANSKDLALKLSEAIACGDWRLFFWHRDQIKNVSRDDVLRVARAYLLPSNRTSGIFLPTKEQKRATISRAPDLATVLDTLSVDGELSSGEKFLADASSIDELVLRRDLTVHQKMGILPKKTRGQMVRAQIKFRFANAHTLKPFIHEYELIPSLLWRGTSQFSYQAIRDRIDALMSTMDINGHAGALTFTIKSEHSYVDEMLSLVAHICQEPLFKRDEFLLCRQREVDNFEEVKSDPQRLAFHELERLKSPWPKDHFHHVYTFEEIVDALKNMSVENVIRGYEKAFSADRFYLSIVGDCNPQILEERAGQDYAQAKPVAPYERISRPFIENIVDEVTLDTKDKEMAMIAYAFNFPMRDDHEDFAALKLANYMFGENMNSRLMNRIREKEGISYGAGSSIEISRYEDNATLSLYAMAAPESVTRAKRAIEEEWQKFIEYGVSETELKAAKESYWLSFENLLANDGYLTSALNTDLESGRDFKYRENLLRKMKTLTTSDISLCTRKWWGNAAFSKVCAGDTNKIKC